MIDMGQQSVELQRVQGTLCQCLNSTRLVIEFEPADHLLVDVDKKVFFGVPFVYLLDNLV